MSVDMAAVMEAWQKVANAFKKVFEEIKRMVRKAIEMVAEFNLAMEEFHSQANARCQEGFNPCMADCPVAYSCRMTRQRMVDASQA